MMQHKGTKRLETQRLILRAFVKADGAMMYRNWCSDPEVTKYLTWPPHENVEESERIAAMWEAETEKPDFYQWAIELRETGEAIGSIAVVSHKDDIRSADLGYCLGRNWWGQGIMPEAVKTVIRFLIQEVGMNRVAACHDRNNPNSGRVMQKAGMTQEGIWRAAGKNNQGRCDEVWYSILAEELEA